MLIYLFKIINVFLFLFFFIFRPINEFLLDRHLVPYLNNLYINHPEISFDHSVDNLIIKINDLSQWYSLPFNEYYIMVIVVFLPKILMKEYLHIHILNFTLVLITPFLYYCILYKLYKLITIFSIIQTTANFYFLIVVIFDFLAKFGPKSLKIEIKK